MSKEEPIGIQIVTPGWSDDALTDALRSLTRAIYAHDPEHDLGGALGGPDGYGANIETPVFTMRRFYWGNCTCGAHDDPAEPPHKPTCAFELPNFVHKPTGFEVRWYKWIGRDNETKGTPPADLAQMVRECAASLPPLPPSETDKTR